MFKLFNLRKGKEVIVTPPEFPKNGKVQNNVPLRGPDAPSVSGEYYNIGAAIKDTAIKLRQYGILFALVFLAKGGPATLFASEGVVSDSAVTTLWLTGFAPGSADLGDINPTALSSLDSLAATGAGLQFFGAADSLDWPKFKPQISGAINTAKALERALKLRARYGRGETGVTHENIRGVKVIIHNNSSPFLKITANNFRSPDYNNVPLRGPTALAPSGVLPDSTDRYAGWFIWQSTPDSKPMRNHFLYLGIERVIPGDMPTLAGIKGMQWKGHTWSGEFNMNVNISDSKIYLGIGFKYRQDYIPIFRGINETRYAILFPITYQANMRAYLAIMPEAVFHTLEINNASTHAAVRPAIAIRPSLRLLENLILSATFEIMWVQLGAAPGLIIEYPDTNFGLGLGWIFKN